MSDPTAHPLWVQSLEIGEFAGVTPDSAFTLKNLSPGINIIYGPNGCGKSTSARAIQALLWPKTSSEYRDIAAVIQRDHTQWQLNCRGRDVQCFVDGQASALPAWSSSETRNRYHWSLQNLLRDQDEDLARQIAREMAGGIDFQKLAADLNWQKKPGAPAKLHQQYLNAERKVRETREHQQGLKQEARHLTSLIQHMQEAAESAARIPGLSRVQEFQEKTIALQSVAQKLAAFPEGMKNLHGDDADLLESLRKELVQLSAALQETQGQREALGEGEKDWALFGSRDFVETRKELERYLHQLRDLQHEIKDADKTLSGLEAKEQSLRSSIGIHRQAALDLSGGFDFPELRQWIRLVFRHIEHQERKTLVQDALQEEDALHGDLDLDSLREARLNLESWLKSQQPAAALPQLPFLLSQLILCGLLIYLGASGKMSWFWTPLLLPAPLLQIWLKRQQKDRYTAELEKRHPAGVPQPESWQPEAVQQNLKVLDQAIRDRHAFDLLESDRRRLQTVENALRDIDAEILQHQNALQAAGLTVENEPAWLAHFMESVQTWRQLRSDLAAAEAHKALLDAQEESVAASLGTHLQKWGQSTQGLSLSGATDSLSERMEREVARRQKGEQLALTLSHQQQQLQARSQSIQAICERVGLSEPDLNTLRQRVALREEWADTLRSSETLQARLSELRNLLGGDLSLTELSREAVEQEMLKAENAKQRELALRDQISKLEQRIEDQRRGRGVHEAEEALSECREALRSERDQQLETRLGMEIISWLQEQCRSRDRSRVLEEANRNLVSFSQTTLQLHLSLDEGEGEFTASRPGKPPLPLAKLSAGERSQVLMAVRLAFLKLNESAPLPLLVDEALGTTDDQRGEQVIRALIEVSRQGRQIFYFTAQQDEVDKWRQVLQDEKESANIVDLAALRAGSAPGIPPALIPKPSRNPDFRQQPGESLTDWAQRLQIPAWHPAQPVEMLSLWHLLYDQPTRLQPLFEQGIQSVGQWMIYEQSGALNSRSTPEIREAVNLQIAALRSLRQNWQIGRPPKVPAKALIESGIVSDRFTRDLVTLLETVDADAARLIDALDNKAVQGFLQKKIRELESWLREAGYLSDIPALSSDEIKARTMAEFESPDAQNLPWAKLQQLIFQDDNPTP